MNSAFNDNQAATKAVRIARVALRGALACALVFGAGTAFAQQYGGDRRDDPQQHQPGGRERFSLPQQDRGQRDADMRAYEEQRRAQQQYQQQQQQQYQQQQAQQAQQYGQSQRDDPRRASGRLTPDERRDLRRQINEAGMDLYQRRR
jgi:hypothetical protein